MCTPKTKAFLRFGLLYSIVEITRGSSLVSLFLTNSRAQCSISETYLPIQQAHMATSKLYVGGIPYRTTEDELRTVFEEAGTVTSASIISDRMTGRSRGFGFVEMASEAEGQAAIDRWDGKEMDGRMLSVSMARPQGERPPRDNNAPRGGGYGGGDRGGYSGGNDRGGSRGGYGGGGNNY
jgi:cold-inducible RNA-binding protein